MVHLCSFYSFQNYSFELFVQMDITVGHLTVDPIID